MKMRKLLAVMISVLLVSAMCLPCVFAEEVSGGEAVAAEAESAPEPAAPETNTNDEVVASEENSVNIESSDGGSGESTDGGSDESTDGGSGESTDGGSGESTDGGSGESTDGDSGESTDGGSGESTDGGSGESTDGDSGESTDGDSGESTDGSSDPTETPAPTETPTPTETPVPTETSVPTGFSVTFTDHSTGGSVSNPYTADATIDWKISAPEDVPEGITYRIDLKNSNGTSSISDSSSGSFTLTLTNYVGDNELIAYYVYEGVDYTIGSCSVTLQAGGMPSGMGGMGGMSGMSGGTASGVTVEEEGIVAGEALISSHTSGSKTMALDTAINTVMDEGASALVLNGHGAVVSLDKGTFSIEVADNIMKLAPTSEGDYWMISGLALKTLKDAGIDQLDLGIGDTVVTMSTDFEPVGYLYGKLRSQGIVSSEFIYTISADDIAVSVNGTDYTIDDNGELKPIEV